MKTFDAKDLFDNELVFIKFCADVGEYRKNMGYSRYDFYVFSGVAETTLINFERDAKVTLTTLYIIMQSIKKLAPKPKRAVVQCYEKIDRMSLWDIFPEKLASLCKGLIEEFKSKT